MTDDKIALSTLLENSSDASFLREMIGFAAERLMQLETAAICNAAPTSVPLIIPACAGNAFAISAYRMNAPVHPRVCGERFIADAHCEACSGSSPRVRGTLISPLGALTANRFIPACAGNALVLRLDRHDYPVHPRVCGERTA